MADDPATNIRQCHAARQDECISQPGVVHRMIPRLARGPASLTLGLLAFVVQAGGKAADKDRNNR